MSCSTTAVCTSGGRTVCAFYVAWKGCRFLSSFGRKGGRNRYPFPWKGERKRHPFRGQKHERGKKSYPFFLVTHCFERHLRRSKTYILYILCTYSIGSRRCGSLPVGVSCVVRVLHTLARYRSLDDKVVTGLYDGDERTTVVEHTTTPVHEPVEIESRIRKTDT